MGITTTQLWNNIFLILVVALIIEVCISAIFSIKMVDNLFKTPLMKMVKNLFVIIVALGLCMKIPALRLFFGSKLSRSFPDVIHLILTTLFLARMSNVFHNFMQYVKRNAQNQN